MEVLNQKKSWKTEILRKIFSFLFLARRHRPGSCYFFHKIIESFLKSFFFTELEKLS